LRYKQFTRKAGFLFVLAIDTSGSMARERIEKARRVAMVILHRAYLRRDVVALITFRALGAELALPPSQSVLRAKRTLDALATGGGTPLSAGISEALDVVRRSKERNAVILLFTDGGANVPMTTSYGPGDRESMIATELASLGGALRRANVNAFVLDTRNRFTRNGHARKVAERLGAEYVQI
jgi:magnesium chelatase subunit D